MPEMDGVALCKAVRNMQLDGYVYALLLTARDSKEHIIAGLEAGADDYLIKPVHEPELIARLNAGRRILNLEHSLRVANHRNRGEEFLIVLPETAHAGAMHVADKIRTLISSTPFATRGGDAAVTASFGVASTGPCGPDIGL